MRIVLATLLALSACAPSQSPGRYGFRSSSSTEALDRPSGPPVTVPATDIAAPLGGISRSCAPSPSGVTAECRAF